MVLPVLQVRSTRLVLRSMFRLMGASQLDLQIRGLVIQPILIDVVYDLSFDEVSSKHLLYHYIGSFHVPVLKRAVVLWYQ